jgi:hypothetical protein
MIGVGIANLSVTTHSWQHAPGRRLDQHIGHVVSAHMSLDGVDLRGWRRPRLPRRCAEHLYHTGADVCQQSLQELV